MARAATTADAFNAVAEARRRQILDVLAGGERPVNDLVVQLGLAQPQVSKHLRVLREVGAVDVRESGRQRLYRLNGNALKPIHDWVKEYERTWSERFDQLDVVLEDLMEKEEDDGNDDQRDCDGDASVGHADPDHAGVRRAQAPRLQGVDDA
jgi:DNA-binding transcriptional ArsR family regulator